MANLTDGASTSSREDSPVRISAAWVQRPGLTVSGRLCGCSSQESFAWFDPVTSSWRTSAILPFEGLDEFSATWPRWGLMRNGKCYRHRRLAPRIDATVYSLWPTLLRSDATAIARYSVNTLRKMPTAARTATRHGGARLCEALAGELDSHLDPAFAEWLMGFPPAWTELQP
jgi:hypothetical protein